MAINDGIGCKKCPVEDCAGSYRGSWCAAERAKFGLGDPLTNFERIKAMSVGELANFLDSEIENCHFEYVEECPQGGCPECFKKWLESEVQDEEEN